ncbi:hypothetical protein DXM26_20535 [Agrobacterium tumefaciens]|uniref:hypothetical protein n=1 Tax=Agrobacterium tumefaciens TaxID=358 RepID=UPI00122FD072|nr:hypothetical protein DXM26_20535 [Agrobacterium tumefaciens]
MTSGTVTINVIPGSGNLQVDADALVWAIQHQPTREAYRKSTGEDAGPVLDRYVAWAQENIIGDAF